MNKQQKRGATIFVILSVVGITFNLYNPIILLVYLALIFCAICVEIAKSTSR